MKPNQEIDSEKSRLDILKWGVIAILLAGGTYAHYHFASIAMPLRIIAWIGMLGVVSAIALQTAKGAAVLAFAKLSHVEMRKVVWPTRQETVQITIIVMITVVVASIILWGEDSILLWLVGLLTGQRG